MLTGLDPKEVVEYVSVLDKGDNPTKFLLGVLTGRDRIALMSTFETDDKNPEAYYSTVFKGLKGIKNLGGKDIDIITDEVLNTLPTIVLKELFSQLLEINFMQKEERKN